MKKRIKVGLKRCACGCGRTVRSGQKFIRGHNFRGKKHSPQTKEVLRKKRNSKLQADQESLSPHRLKFPSRKKGESLSDFYFRKFELFCSRYCLHVQGKFFGKPVILMRWQQEILKKLFTVDESGKRIYRRLLVHIPRKQGKTFMVGLLILYWLAEESFSDMGAEIISVANTRQQSQETIFKTCRQIVQYSKGLDQLIKTRLVPASLENRLTHAIYQPLASDSKPQLGRNVSLACFDETLGQVNEELWSCLATSQAAREQPLFVSISTAGDSRASFYYTVYEKMKEIKENPAVDPTTLVSIHECPEEIDWRSEEAFKIANPALSSEGEEGFRSEDEIRLMRKAALEGEGENGYRQYYLNQWSKYGSKLIVPLPKWDLCAVDDLDPGPESVGWIGLDLSLTTALTGVAILFAPEGSEKKWKLVTYGWLAGENISECSRRDHLSYEKWVNSQILFFDGKLTIDPTSILDLLLKVKYQYPNAKTIGFDPYASEMLKGWEDYFDMIPIPQQYGVLSPAIKALQVMILNGSIEHEGDPLMRSMIENARLLEDPSGNLRLDKSRSISRIDCLSALVCAMAASMGKKEE
jgi:phage terminase large subunit-like protein